LNKQATILWLSGLKGSMGLKICSTDPINPLSICREFSKDARGVMIYSGDQAQNMIIQTPNSNCLRLVD
jgi:hypothetical protein